MNGALMGAEGDAYRQRADLFSPPPIPGEGENYIATTDSPVKQVAEAQVSTFSIDVDTGAYSNIRRFLMNGQMPPKDAVRVEEMINYFSYDYPGPDARGDPFRVTTVGGAHAVECRDLSAACRHQGL